jgi:Helix-turn-helix domain
MPVNLKGITFHGDLSKAFKRPHDATQRVADIEWAAQQLKLSCAQVRRLARQGKLPGAYRAQRNGHWRIRRIVFLDALEKRIAK